MIKQYIKNILPRPAQNFVGQFFNRNNYPYSLNTNFKLPNSISDAFIFSNFCSKIEFVSENLRALLLGHDHEIEHCFTFYSPDGLLLNKVYTKSQKYISRTILDAPNWTDRYFMFTHEILSNTRLEDLIQDPSSRINYWFASKVVVIQFIIQIYRLKLALPYMVILVPLNVISSQFLNKGPIIYILQLIFFIGKIPMTWFSLIQHMPT